MIKNSMERNKNQVEFGNGKDLITIKDIDHALQTFEHFNDQYNRVKSLLLFDICGKALGFHKIYLEDNETVIKFSNERQFDVILKILGCTNLKWDPKYSKGSICLIGLIAGQAYVQDYEAWQEEFYGEGDTHDNDRQVEVISFRDFQYANLKSELHKEEGVNFFEIKLLVKQLQQATEALQAVLEDHLEEQDIDCKIKG